MQENRNRSGYINHRKDDNKAIAHVYKLTSNKCNRHYLSGKINLFDQISIHEHAACACRDAGTDKNPRDKGNKQKKVIVFYLLLHDDRKKRKCKQKAEGED